MSKVVVSPDISLLDFSVLLDISIANATVRVTNLSTVINPTQLDWIFTLTTPMGTNVHISDFNNPDINSIPFINYTFPEALPKAFGQYEYSNTDKYTVKVSVRDSIGKIFSLEKSAALCKPNGNTGQGNFGAAAINVQVKCNTSQVFITDKTNTIYNSLIGEKESTLIELTYPRDKNGNTLASSTAATLPALLPIKYEGEGHEVYVYHIYKYDMGDSFFVKIRYSFTKSFAVYCTITLAPLLCEVSKIVASLGKNCTDTIEKREIINKLSVVNYHILHAQTGILEPLSGIDVPKIIEEVKQKLDIDCSCFVSDGVSNTSNVILSDASLTVNKTGGDMLLSWSNDGLGNIVLNYQDKSYTFLIGGGSSAFRWDSTVIGSTKQNVLYIDPALLSQEILIQISNNDTLRDTLNGIVQQNMFACSGLDGGVAVNLSSCTYSVIYNTTRRSTATMFRVLINGVYYTAPTATLATNATAIQTWLNSLSKGTFVVVFDGVAGQVSIQSNNNTNTISNISTIQGDVIRVFQFTNNCGLICNMFQKIFDYLNAINLVKIKSGVGLTICRFKEDGTVLETVFGVNDDLSAITTFMANSFCNLVNYTKDKLLTCDNIKKLFAAHTPLIGIPNAGDVVPMWINGKCISTPLKVLAQGVFQLLLSDTDVKNIYCQVTPCSSVNSCSPVTGLVGMGGDNYQSYNWNPVVGATGYKWSINGTTFFSVTSTTVLISGLVANTAYVFRVYPVYLAGDGVSCQINTNFTTTNAGITCAAPGSLILNGITTSSFVATWNGVTGATGYQYRIAGGAWVNTGTALTATITGLNSSTGYNFEVRAIIGGLPCPDIASGAVTTSVNGSLTINPPGVNPLSQGNPSSTGTIAATIGTTVYVRVSMSGTDGAATMSYTINGVSGLLTNATSPRIIPVIMPTASITWSLSLTTSVPSQTGAITLI